ncbi:hypothetical protein U2G54_000968 [Vibrio fluvialis]|nr:hypothetical protein [Vibrio fluvialis]EMA2479556.1 hypothetical protein [Vibrio fluvialis]
MKQFDKREVIGGLLVLFVGVLIGSFWLSDVAEPVQAFFTSLGSLATALTLVFLIVQNTSQAKEIKEERQKREAHEEKQQEMWKEQRKNITFTNLLTHKSLFHDMLNDIEKNLNVAFFDRTGLYKDIFLVNGSRNINANIADDQITLGSLQDTKIIHQLVITELSNYEDMITHRFVEDHLTNLLRLGSALHLTLPNNHYFGDITFPSDSEDVFITNIFSPNKTTSIYEHVLEHLCDFAEIDFRNSRTNWETSFYLDALRKFSFRDSFHHGFNINLGQILESTQTIYEAYQYVKCTYLNFSSHFTHAVLEVEDTFYSRLRSVTEREAAVHLKQCAEVLCSSISNFDSEDPKLENHKHELLKAIDMLDNRNKILRSFKRK